MALTGALCCVVHALTGFTNRSLRGLVAGLLDPDYTTSQMTYDLRRLRLHGLIERIPHTNTYAVTTDGTRVRRLLHQSPRPRAATPARSLRPGARTHRASPRPEHDRPSPQRLHHQRPTRRRRLKPVTTSQDPAPKQLAQPQVSRSSARLPDRACVRERRSASVKERGLVKGVRARVVDALLWIRFEGCCEVPHQGVLLRGGSVARHLSALFGAHGAVGPRPARTQSVSRRRHRGGSHAVSECACGSCPSFTRRPAAQGSGSGRRVGRSTRGS